MKLFSRFKSKTKATPSIKTEEQNEVTQTHPNNDDVKNDSESTVALENHGYIGDSGYFTDSRDNNTYKWVRINGQIWMAENLRFNHFNESYSYNNDSGKVNEIGRLYTRKAAIESCPTGWRLPLAYDYEMLIDSYGSDNDEILKNIVQNGDSGFNLKFGGRRWEDREFSSIADSAYYWSSTFDSQGLVFYLQAFKDSSIKNNYTWDEGLKERMALSVRCIYRTEEQEAEILRDYMQNKYAFNEDFYSDHNNIITVLVNIARNHGFMNNSSSNGYFDSENENIEAKRLGYVIAKLVNDGVFTVGPNHDPISVNDMLWLMIKETEKELPYDCHGQLKFLWKDVDGFWY